jgi:acetylornithine deacetylase/succinyl-diaminopimelate desuccinylase-like protein
MQDIYDYIDQHADEFVRRLQTLCRQPSIAAQGQGMAETADMVLELLRQAGAQPQLVPTGGLSPTGGFPVVFGAIPGRTARTLSFYDHYDVQPPEPLELWHSEPFGAEIRDGRIWARGVADNKGNLMARLCAVQAWQEVRGELPLNVKFIVEGEEEIGSPNLPAFAASHGDLLAADGCIWEAGYKDTQGRPEIYLGVKGILYVQLSVSTANADLHSSWAAVVPNPVWRLAWALNSLKDQDERILIPGFYDAVREPTPEEIQALERMDFDEEGQRRLMGLEGFLGGLSGTPLLIKYLFQPTCNVCGVSGGYEGPGSKTVLPNRAFLKMDFRLVPDQDPGVILQQLRAHLDAQGFEDIEIEVLGPEHPARTPLDDPLVEVVVSTARQVYGVEPVVYPLTAGTGPMYEICQKFGIPSVSTGVGNAESHTHAPNENVVIADFIQGIKHIALIIKEYAAI